MRRPDQRQRTKPADYVNLPLVAVSITGASLEQASEEARVELQLRVRGFVRLTKVSEAGIIDSNLSHEPATGSQSVACNPLSIQNGLFLTGTAWSTAPSTSFDGKTVMYAAGGANPGISVQQGANSVFHAQLAGRTLKYLVLGTPQKYLLILDAETGSSSQRWVSLVDFSTWTEVPILTVLASGAVALPVVNASQGNGSVFLAYGQDGTSHTSVAVHRSDNGAVLCALGPIFAPTGQTAGEATATQLIIHYSTGGTSKTFACPKPVGQSQITPSLQTFSNVAVGGCPFTPQTRQFTIKNVGADCLTVNSISNSPPFDVTAMSRALPAVLAHNETLVVTAAFNPTAIGSWPSAALGVTTTPANGDKQLVCKGTAVAATFSIGFNATTFNWGSQPVGVTSASKTLTITNNGSKPLNISVAPIAVSGFSCAGFNGTLNCGVSQSLAIGFTPPAEGPQSATLGIGSPASGSPHAITLLGTGCVANAEIAAPATAPHDFGQVQQGFRTVWIFEIKNIGDGTLTFNGTIGGADVALFGLPDPAGSVTAAPASRSYTALPVTPCGSGPAGSGKVLVAVSFFANDVPKLANATLTISGHNATNYPPTQTWTIPLTTEITPPVALDVALVVDRSGSMNDVLGSRVKIDAAVAASQLFVELLRPDIDDRVGVVRFNELADVVVAMSPVSSTNAPTQATIRSLVQSSIPPVTGNTAIAAGSIFGIREIEKPRATTPAALTRALIVLTDGIENTGFEDPPGSGTWVSINGGQMLRPLPATGTVSTSPFTRPAGIEIYVVGVGTTGQVDPTQLSALAGDPGHVFRVDQELTGTHYFQLEKYFTQIFMDIVGTASVLDPMYWISPGDKHEIDFDVLRGDVNALVVIYDFEGKRLPFWCISPQGEILDPLSIPPGFQLRAAATNEARVVEFKMPLNEPDRYAGRWKVVVEHPGKVCFGMPPAKRDNIGFVSKKCRGSKVPVLYGIAIGVGSNFRMAPFVTPAPVYVGDPILLTALVSEAGLPVTGCTVTVEATAPGGATSSQTLFDDGAHADGGRHDGEYANTFTHSFVPGVYHFKFTTVGTSRDGEPVVREAVRDKPVLARDPVPPDGHGRDGVDCCDELLKTLRKQTALLERFLKKKSA